MNGAICEREDQTLAAVRTGTIDSETASHAQHCLTCSDILLVGEFLGDGSSLTQQERTTLPDAGLIWQKAQHRANDEAVRLVLRPIRFMKIIAVVAFLLAPWLRWLPTGSDLFGSWTRNLDFNLEVISRIWPATASQLAILLGFAAATILLSVSSWYMARQE